MKPRRLTRIVFAPTILVLTTACLWLSLIDRAASAPISAATATTRIMGTISFALRIWGLLER